MMDTQNMDRRDSKKSTKGGGGGVGNKNSGRNNTANAGGLGNGSGGVGGNGKSAGEKQRSHSQKTGKPYREIYKPPSMRSTKNRNSNSYSEEKVRQNEEKSSSPGTNQQSKRNSFSKNGNGSGSSIGSSSNSPPQQNGNYGSSIGSSNDGIDSSILNSQNGYSLFGNGSNGNSGNGSVPLSPLISNRMQQQQQQNAFNIGLAKRMLNVNAKEFQFLPSFQQQQQQISNFLSQFDPSSFYNTNSPILASSGCYPLKQSKSSGNMNLLLQQQQQQQQQQQAQAAAALQQLQNAIGFGLPLQTGNFSVPNSNNGSAGMNNSGGGNCQQFNRLSQSKSSGNVPGNGNKPRVRFDDEEQQEFDDVDDFVMGQLGNYLASLKLNGDVSGMSSGSQFPSHGYSFQQQQQQQQQLPKQNKQNIPVSPQPVLKSSLQKSRTGFYLNLYGNQQQQQHQQHQQQQQQQQQINLSSPTKSIYAFSNSPSSNLHGSNYASKVTTSGGIIGNNSGQQQQQQHFSFPSTGMSNVVKRSRSFGPGTHHFPRASATMLLSASTNGPSTSGHSVYTDFCITKWPRVVQELVTAAVTGVERIPARNWIEMVNSIFEAMLCDYRSTKKDRNFFPNSQSIGITSTSINSTADGAAAASSNTKMTATAAGKSNEASVPAEESCGNSQRNGGGANNANSAARNNDFGLSPDIDDNEEEDDDDDDEDDDDDTDLTSAAVHIFLYFIQREKDRTVMESLLNTCFASFQRLSSCSISSSSGKYGGGKSQQQRIMTQQIGKPSISRQWSNFLRFLSTLYAQVKLIRRQKQNQQQPGQSMDEMSFSLLALLCDSCLATLRSPQSYTAEMMGCLFTVLTSIGRDMEGTFPLKMKQLLAAVRDALLGIGPYQQHHYPNSSNNSTTSSSSAPSSKSSGLSPIVQKTLMQLIELHAANWQLPASAVRYYYSSVGSGNNGSGRSSSTSNNATNTTSNSSSSSLSSSTGSVMTQKNANNSSASSNVKQKNFNSSTFTYADDDSSSHKKLSHSRKQSEEKTKDKKVEESIADDNISRSKDNDNDENVEIDKSLTSSETNLAALPQEDQNNDI